MASKYAGEPGFGMIVDRSGNAAAFAGVDQGGGTSAILTASSTTGPGGSPATVAYTRIQDGNTTTLASIIGMGLDGVSAGLNGLVSSSFSLGYNGTTWDRLRAIAGSLGVLQVSNAGRTNTAVAAATAAAAVKGSAGRLASILVTSVGTEIKCDRAFLTSAYVNSSAGSPALTVSYD